MVISKASTTGLNHIINPQSGQGGRGICTNASWLNQDGEVELASVVNRLWMMVGRANHRPQTNANQPWWTLNWLHFAPWIDWSPVILSPVERSAISHRCQVISRVELSKMALDLWYASLKVSHEYNRKLFNFCGLWGHLFLQWHQLSNNF